MATSDFPTRKYFTRDLAAFNDAELDHFLQENTLDGGAVEVDVEDPENLPENFIQRLGDRAQLRSGEHESRPVDPDELTARLLDISSGKTPVPRPSPPSTSCSFDSADWGEKKDYKTLVEDGGRPCYDIVLIDEVFEDKFSHWDMLRPWVGFPPDSDPDPENEPDVFCGVFQNQLRDWRAFRDWQQINRGDISRWDKLGYFRCHVCHQFVGLFQRHCPIYTDDAIKKLLAEYGFTRPFQFQQDPTRQDKLTTWIEYLGYLWILHYRSANRVKEMQPVYDEAWKELVDSGAMRPGETEEYMCDLPMLWAQGVDEDRAFLAVKSARLAVDAVRERIENDVNHPRGPRLTPEERSRMMEAAESRCQAAIEAQASIKRRGALISAFRRPIGSFLVSRRYLLRLTLRVRWALEQVPLFEAELGECSMAKISPTAVHGKKRGPEHDEYDEATHDGVMKKQKRDVGEPGPTLGRKDRSKRSRDVAVDAGPPSKRLKHHGKDLDSHRENSTLDSHEFASVEIEESDGDERSGRTVERPKRHGSKLSSGHQQQQRASTHNTRQAVTSPHPLRRSARIAARQGTLQVATTDSAPPLPQSSRRSTSQTALHTGSQDQLPGLPETKVKRRDATRRRRC